MDTMTLFQLSKLDDYYRNHVSFKCMDIMDWCMNNIDNEDFDVYYAANEIYKHYFGPHSKKTQKNAYYYIKNNSYSSSLYYLERDPVLSNYSINDIVDIEKIKSFLNRIDILEEAIVDDKHFNRDDQFYLEDINKTYRRRLKLITRRGRVHLDRFCKYSEREKKLVFNICQDKLQSLELRLAMLQYIK